MDLRDLVNALLAYDALSARQWLADAVRSNLVWKDLEAPEGLDQTAFSLAAGVVELFAERAQQPAPAWTAQATPLTTPRFLVRAAETMPRLRRACEREGPEPLRRRGFLAPPGFLTAA